MLNSIINKFNELTKASWFGYAIMVLLAAFISLNIYSNFQRSTDAFTITQEVQQTQRQGLAFTRNVCKYLHDRDSLEDRTYNKQIAGIKATIAKFKQKLSPIQTAQLASSEKTLAEYKKERNKITLKPCSAIPTPAPISKH